MQWTTLVPLDSHIYRLIIQVYIWIVSMTPICHQGFKYVHLFTLDNVIWLSDCPNSWYCQRAARPLSILGLACLGKRRCLPMQTLFGLESPRAFLSFHIEWN